jgi:hypothetical protein
VLDAFFVFPMSGLEAAFDVDLLALGKVLFANFGKVAPCNDVEPLGFGMVFPVGSIP